jgi:hypothetical protein
MPDRYKIENISGITKITFLKKPTYVDAQNIIDEISKNNAYEKRLWDLTKVDFNFTLEEIKNISKYGKSKLIEPNKLAVVAFNDLAYGEMRQFMVYREEDVSSVCVFRCETEAFNWLNS